jgi:hypothetical protein
MKGIKIREMTINDLNLASDLLVHGWENTTNEVLKRTS